MNQVQNLGQASAFPQYSKFVEVKPFGTAITTAGDYTSNVFVVDSVLDDIFIHLVADAIGANCEVKLKQIDFYEDQANLTNPSTFSLAGDEENGVYSLSVIPRDLDRVISSVNQTALKTSGQHTTLKFSITAASSAAKQKKYAKITFAVSGPSGAVSARFQACLLR